jgi:hypothetical protein
VTNDIILFTKRLRQVDAFARSREVVGGNANPSFSICSFGLGRRCGRRAAFAVATQQQGTAFQAPQLSLTNRAPDPLLSVQKEMPRESHAKPRTIGGVLGSLVIYLGAIWVTALAIVKFLDETWLLDEDKRRLKERFEAWWVTVENLDRQKFALAVATKISKLLDSYFGSRLFSKQVVWRCSSISTGFLVAS